MTDHLPECPMLDEQYPKHPLEDCPYCKMLRACEQRALDAAREAVAFMPGPSMSYGNREYIEREAALKAIDRLKDPQ